MPAEVHWLMGLDGLTHLGEISLEEVTLGTLYPRSVCWGGALFLWTAFFKVSMSSSKI